MTVPNTPRDFDLMYADYLNHNMSDGEWHLALTQIPGLAEHIEDLEQAMRRKGYANGR